MPQGQSYFTNFLRQPDNSPQDPISNNLNPLNPNYPYASTFAALFAALGAVGVGNPVKSLFRAHMTNNQTVLAGHTDKLVMDVADVNLPGAGNYSTVNRRWTPPAGAVLIRASALATVFTTTDSCAIIIVKNGVTFPVPLAQSVLAVTGGFMSAFTIALDQANGSDFYEAWFSNPGSHNFTLNNNAANTSWTGTMWPGP